MGRTLQRLNEPFGLYLFSKFLHENSFQVLNDFVQTKVSPPFEGGVAEGRGG